MTIVGSSFSAADFLNMERPGQLAPGLLLHEEPRAAMNLPTIDESADYTQPHERAGAPGSRRHLTSPDGEVERPAKRQKGPFSCQPCGKYYTEKRALARHKHSEAHHRNAGLAPPDKVQCSYEFCTKSFVRNHDRERHEKEAHRGERRVLTTRTSPSEEESAKVDDRSTMSPFPNVHFIQEKSFLVEDGTMSSHEDWEALASYMEVLPGPANWSITQAYEAKAQAIANRSHLLEPCSSETALRKDSTADSADTSSLTIATTVDRTSQSWFDEDSDSEDVNIEGEIEEIGPRPDTQLSQNTSKSGAVDSAVDLAEEDVHEPKRPSITTYDYRDECVDQQSEQSAESEYRHIPSPPSETELDLILPLRQKLTVIQKSGKKDTSITTDIPLICDICDKPLPTSAHDRAHHLRIHLDTPHGKGAHFAVAADAPLICAMCDEPFPTSDRDRTHHLRVHLDTLQGNRAYYCSACQVGFVHKADLDRHSHSANELNHCGFQFEHKQPCTGHHPPDQNRPDTELSDRDRLRLNQQLWHWEQSQLRVYMSAIDQLAARDMNRASACYSMEAVPKKYRDSLSSFAISVNTYGSAPCDRGGDGELDVGGLRHRMKMLSLKGSRVTVKKLPSILRAGGSLSKGLYNAVSSNDHRQIKNLVDHGGDTSAVVGDRSILSVAAERAELDTVRMLLDLGASVHTPERKFGSALGSAAHAGRLDVCDLLLAYGANVTQSGGKYGCPLGAAAASGQPGCIEVAAFLISKGANVSHVSGEFHCPISTAAAYGNASMVRFLIDHGAQVNQPGGDEGSPLGFAVWHDHLNTAKTLIANGANLDATSRRHGNCLCAAISRVARREWPEGGVKMVQLLLQHGAHPDQQHTSHNPLRTACGNANIEPMTRVVRLLLEHNANPDGPGAKVSAMQLAKQCRQKMMERKPFLSMETNPELDDIIGHCYEIIRLLREAGAVDEDRRSNSFS